MSSTAADNRWKKVPKARRAAVYRAIGRASREAREAKEKETAADVRIAMDVLRAHAKSGPRRPSRGRRR